MASEETKTVIQETNFELMQPIRIHPDPKIKRFSHIESDGLSLNEYAEVILDEILLISGKKESKIGEFGLIKSN